MPEINPYEPPQTAHEDLRKTPTDDLGYPAWIAFVLNAQLMLFLLGPIVLYLFIGPAVSRDLSTMISCAAIAAFAGLSLSLIIAAIRYRIGWLLVIELIVLGLPLVAWYQL